MPHGDLHGFASEPKANLSDNQGYEFCIWAPEEPA
jgi:hypothetical protein